MPREPKEGEDYLITLWDKYKNYQCIQCQYATLYWELYVQHYRTANKHKHVWAYPKPKDPNDTQPQGYDPELIY